MTGTEVELPPTVDRDRAVWHTLAWLLLFVTSAAYLVVLIRTSWLGEDAYITFRAVDNWLNGYGPRWNIHERSQVYTHPLWFLIVSGLVYLTREFYLSVQVLSIAVSLLSVGIVAFGVARGAAAGATAVWCLACSKAFMDYSTSGLENPLTHLLVAGFLWLWFSARDDARKVFPLALIAGLAVLNRMDTLLFFAPAMGWLLWRTRSIRSLLLMGIGFLPFVVWEVASVIYYGFLFPNTAYAKLNTGIPRIDLIQEGIGHFIALVEQDPVSLLVVFWGFAVPIWTRDLRAGAVAAGGLMYCAYFVWVGGDYMLGRFMSTPVFVAAILLSRIDWRVPQVLPAAAAVFVVLLQAPYPVLFVGPDNGLARHEGARPRFQDIRQVSDQQAIYCRATALLNGPANGWEAQNGPARAGRSIAKRGRELIDTGPMGYRGFYAGPEAVFIDAHALADPLMARLPLESDVVWRSGHYLRKRPAGYWKSVDLGENHIENPSLRVYYDKLRTITEGPLWTWDRWKAIWEMNTGQLDYLVDEYLATRGGGARG